MRKVPKLFKGSIIAGLALILILGVASQTFSQDTDQSPIHQTAEIVFEGGARFMTADVLYENLNDGDPDNDPTIISLRSAEDYAKGHIPGAIQMGLATLFTEENLTSLPPDKSVVLVCYTGQSASQATSALNMLGYDAYALMFGMSSWTADPEVFVKRFNPEVHVFDYPVDLEAHEPGGPYELPEPMGATVMEAAAAAFENGARFMTSDVLYENLNDGDPDNDPTIISLRSAEDYAKGHISGAINMGLASLFTEENLASLPPDKSVVLVCYTGQSASQATSVLNMLGYDAYTLLHGMSSWTADPEVFVKRFNPDSHVFDYSIDLEEYEADGTYPMPEPLVAETSAVIAEPVVIAEAAISNVVAASAEMAFEGGARFMTADVLYENLNDGDPDNDPTIISLRSAEDYAKGHIPGAIQMGLTSLFTEEGLASIPPDKSVVLVCYTGQSASQATSALNMLGYDAYALLHGMSSWTADPEVYVKRFNPDTHVFDYSIDLEAHEPGGPYELPEPLGATVMEAAEAAFENGARFMTADVLYENLNDGDPDNDPTIISLRSADDYAKGHIPGAINLGLATLFTEESLASLPPDKSVVLVCYTGQSASQATSALNMLGYDAYSLMFGMSSWTDDPEVYVKRFNPDTNVFDYAVDLEAYAAGGPYPMPEPLVEAAPEVVAEPVLIAEPTVGNVVAATAEMVFEGGARFMTADVLYENLNDGDPENDPTIISLRSAEDYAKGHVPGAVQMGLTSLFTEEGLAGIPPDKSVVLVCYTGQSASQATSALNMLGYDAYALLHGMSSWTADPEVYVKRFNPDTHVFDYAVDVEAHELDGPYELPEPLATTVVEAAEAVFENGARFMTADVLYENLNDGDPDNDPIIVSLRSAEDYAKGHVPGAVHMGLATLFTEESLASLPPDKSVVLVCYTGQSASQATSALNMLGYDAYSLMFGMSSWTADPEVYVKRFNPDANVFDYAVDLEVHELGGPYPMPEPLVQEPSQPAPEPSPEPTPAPAVAEPPPTTVANNCVSCHTSQGVLETLAVEKEVKSEKTSGEG